MIFATLLAPMLMRLLCGCGAHPAAAPTTPVNAAPTLDPSLLGGNWLLAGSLPVLGAPAGNSPAFGLAADFDVIGNQVTGLVSEMMVCGGFTTVGTEGTVSGTVAPDGSFSLQSPSLNGAALRTITITGTVPTKAGASWSGSYTIANSLGSCPGQLTGPLAATSIPLVSGTFTGTAELNSTSMLPSTTVAVKTTLQQGGTLSTVSGGGSYTNTVLSGTITLTGSSCLTSGSTTGSSLPGSVEGNEILAHFLMNDGSTLDMLGSISALDASAVSVHFITASPGTCPVQFGGYTTLSH